MFVKRIYWNTMAIAHVRFLDELVSILCFALVSLCMAQSGLSINLDLKSKGFY